MNPAPIVLLQSRQQCATCHVMVPDMPDRLAAVALNNQFYSFFKVMPDAAKVLEVLKKLSDRDDQVLVLPNAKGFSLWIAEPDARPDGRHPRPRQSLEAVQPRAMMRILAASQVRQEVPIRVPDQAQPLAAIPFAGRYYSRFVSEHAADRVLEIAGKTIGRGDDTLVVLTEQGYVLYLAEADAVPLTQAA